MFQVQKQAFVEFPSSWSKRRQLEDASCQTHDVENKEVATQSMKKKSVKIQTEVIGGGELVLAQDTSVELLHFLRRVEPTVIEVLERNLRSHAFDDYRLHSEDDVATITTIHSLHNNQLEEAMHVTGLSWNCVGSVIAASYGRFDHEDWCTHRACVSTWNIDRSSLNPNKPDIVIDQSSCVMCVAYHPTQPPLLAAANFNGEVIVWDMSERDEPLVASSGLGDDSHREPVNRIEWIPDSDSRKFQLMSVGGDGKVLMWSVRVKHKSLQLVRGFIVMCESLPASLKSRSTRPDKELGLTCVSYNPDDPDTFVVGSDSGAIFKCSQRTSGTPTPSTLVSSVSLQSPVTFTYTPHNAPVYSLHLSPFHRNVFISCGLDQTAHVYNILQAQPVMVIEPGLGYIYCGQWSPTRAVVAALTTESGHLLVYDLSHGKTTPVHSLQVSEKSAPVYALQFNQKRPNLIATADGLGYIQITKLNEELVNGSDSRDLHALDALTSVKVE